MTTSDNIGALVRSLLALDRETQWIEFKVNNANPEEIGEYISALANGAAKAGKPSGYLLWGVDDADHRLVGTSFDPYRSKIGGEDLENWLLRLLSPKVDFQFETGTVGGHHVVVLQVPRATSTPVQFRGTEFIRVASHKTKLKDHPQIARAIWRSFDLADFESGIQREAIEATHVLTTLDWEAYYSATGVPVPSNTEKILYDLAEEKMIQPSLRGGWDVTSLGAICLARDLSTFGRLGRKALRIIRYAGAGRTNAIGEVVIKQGYVRGLPASAAHIEQTAQSAEVIAVRRDQTHDYPLVAVRELIANALVHQDFSIVGAGPMVELFEGRVEVTSPGLPLVDTQRFLDSPPRSRNEALASFMRRIGFCEERGSGIDRVVTICEVERLPAPEFRAAGDTTVAVLSGPRPYASMTRDERIGAVYLHACLHYVNHERVTNATIRERFGLRDAATASRVIADGVQSGLIRLLDPRAGKKAAQYVPYWA
jgi:ATP-dependent DNA helicase RecG